jgi:hypothetical protein
MIVVQGFKNDSEDTYQIDLFGLLSAGPDTALLGIHSGQNIGNPLVPD